MEAVRVSVITPSVRKSFLKVVRESLQKQTFPRDQWEWIVVSPFEYQHADIWVKDPPKKEGDYYSLNKAWNAAFKVASGRLLVNVVDGIELQVDTLEKLWRHHRINPKACISCIGHQYKDLNEAPVWSDPRSRKDFGSFYEVAHQEMELCVASFPRNAVYDVGGIDEEYDKGAALSEKEMMLRMEKAGYKLYLSQDIEYKAIQHPRLSEEWDVKYKVATKMFKNHTNQIVAGKRLRLEYLNGSDTIKDRGLR